MTKLTKSEHPQLNILKKMWNFNDETLNNVLWANHDDHLKNTAIGFASEYLEHMDAYVGTENPEEAWDSWCDTVGIDDRNPFLD